MNIPRRHELTPWTLVFLLVLLSFFAAFLIYPTGLLLREAFLVDGRWSLAHFQLFLQSPLQVQSVVNSFSIATLTTLGALAVTLPMSWFLTRYQFAGKSWLNTLLLVPLIMPPFVGAIGLKQMLARFGSLNLWLMDLGILDRDQPIDWLGGAGFVGIVLLQILNLYPILLLNLTAAMANVDPSMREAAQNLGATGWRLFRTVTLPLILPGMFGGAIIVFIASFTDLGTPIIFGYSRVVPVQIFDAVNDLNANPMGYVQVVLVAVLTLGLFWISKRWVGSKRYEMLARGHTEGHEVKATRSQSVWLWVLFGGWLALAMAPHLTVLVHSFSSHWFMTVLPESWTLEQYGQLISHDLTARSIRNSLFYASCSAFIDLILGVTIAWMLTRRKVPFSNLLDTLSMLPLALPGVVLAFGYVAAFDFKISWLNPRENPTLLLIVGYSVRRLPYIVRSAYAGFQQTSVTLEEASSNLGATPFQTLRKITLPLITAHLVAGTVLTFAFAMLEVSDSLILAMKDTYFPMTKMIYILLGRIDPNAPSIASALGVVGMLILGGALVVAGKLLGKKLGQLFRSGS